MGNSILLDVKIDGQVGVRRVRSSLIMNNMLLKALGAGGKLQFQHISVMHTERLHLTWAFLNTKSLPRSRYLASCLEDPIGSTTSRRTSSILSATACCECDRCIRKHLRLSGVDLAWERSCMLWAEGVITYNSLGNTLEKGSQSRHGWRNALRITELAQSNGVLWLKEGQLLHMQRFRRRN